MLLHSPHTLQSSNPNPSIPTAALNLNKTLPESHIVPLHCIVDSWFSADGKTKRGETATISVLHWGGKLPFNYSAANGEELRTKN